MGIYRNYHVGPRYQSGTGWGSLFSTVIKGLTPIAKSAIGFGKRAARSAIGREVKKAVTDTIKDAAISTLASAVEGGDTQQALEESLGRGRQRLGESIRTAGRPISTQKRSRHAVEDEYEEEEVKKKKKKRPSPNAIKKKKKKKSPTIVATKAGWAARHAARDIFA